MSDITPSREIDILGLVDVQPTFMPGGELALPEGEAVVPVINRLLTGFDPAFATQDWRPPAHNCTCSKHPGHKPYNLVRCRPVNRCLGPIMQSKGAPMLSFTLKSI